MSTQKSKYDFRTDGQRETDELGRQFQRLRKIAPSETSDYRVCRVIAEERNTTAQRVYYHVKKLGLTRKCVAADGTKEDGGQ